MQGRRSPRGCWAWDRTGGARLCGEGCRCSRRPLGRGAAGAAAGTPASARTARQAGQGCRRTPRGYPPPGHSPLTLRSAPETWHELHSQPLHPPLPLIFILSAEIKRFNHVEGKKTNRKFTKSYRSKSPHFLGHCINNKKKKKPQMRRKFALCQSCFTVIK